MDTKSDNTYSASNTPDNLDVVVGDEKRPDFKPRVKLKKWANEVNLSVGLVDAPGTHEVKDQAITWTQPGVEASFYPKLATQPTPTKLRFVKLGEIKPFQVPAEYELSRHIDWPEPTIVTYWSQPALMYFGSYPASAYVDKVDIPQVRAASGRGNPYYMDQGLVMVDLHHHENLPGVVTVWNDAVRKVMAGHGITVFDKGGSKLYFRDGDREVKFSSPEDAEGHLWTYINLDCDYNHAYDYYKDGVSKDRNDRYAYGLKAIAPKLDPTVVDEIVAVFAQSLGLPLAPPDKWSVAEQAELDRLEVIHQDPAWVNDAKRTDVYHYDQPEDGFEFDIKLDAAPANNVLPLSITTKGLTFDYQPELTPEEAIDAFRPANVVGSYAVYHDSKSNNEYGTGKAFHIYRPWAEDATGNRVWCDLSIDTDAEQMLITIPDSVVYPIRIDPTFGYTTKGASGFANAGKIVGSKFTGAVGTLKLLSVAWNGSVDVNNSKLAVYADSGSTYLATTREHGVDAGPPSPIFEDYLVNPNLTISAAAYDLVFWISASAYANIYYDTGSNLGVGQTLTYVVGEGGWPNPATFTVDNNKYSIYGTYSDSTANVSYTAETCVLIEHIQIIVGSTANKPTATDITWTAENYQLQLVANVNVTDTATISESIGRRLDCNVNVSDTVTLSENVNRQLLSFVSVADTATTSESVGLLLSSNHSVSDSITVTESQTVRLDENPNISDSTTITDTPQYYSDMVATRENVAVVVAAPGVSDLTISKSENVTITESVTPLLTISIAASDSMTVTEALTVLLTSSINVSDSITITEALQRRLDSNVLVSDSVSVTEATTVLVPTLLVGVNDSVTIAEAATVRITSSVAVSDSATVTESVAVSVVSMIVVSDSVAITENADPELVSFVSVAESPTVAENVAVSVTAVGALSISVSENLTVTESVARLLLSFIAVGDSVTATESTLVRLESNIAVSDSITVTESIQLRLDRNVSVSDPIAISESVSLLIPTLFVSISDSITVSESTTVSIAGVTGLQINVNDSVTVTESINNLVTGFISVSDTATTSESLKLLLQSSISCSDSTTVQDICHHFPDTIATREEIAVVLSAADNSLSVAVSDSAAITEALSLLETSLIARSDSVTITEAVTSLLISRISVSDSVTVSESSNVALISNVAASDSVAITESVKALLQANISVNESVTISESIILLIPALFISVFESVTVSESTSVAIVGVTDYLVNVNDSVALTELISLSVSISASVNDSVAVSESLRLLLQSFISVSDSAVISESVVVRLALGNIAVSDSATITEAVKALLTSLISASDAATVSESVSLSIGLAITVSDSVAVSENVVLLVPFLLINVFENITISESTTVSIAGVGAFQVNVNDSVTVTESAALQESTSINVSESVAVSEAVQVRLTSVISASDNPSVLDQRTNQVLNPGAEGGNVSWTKGGATANVTVGSTDFAYKGTQSIKLNITNNDCYAYQDIAVTPGKTYAFSAYIKVSSISAGSVYVVIKKTDFTITYATSSALTSVAGFTQVTGILTVPAGVTTIRLILDNASGTTALAYYDAVLFELNNDNQPYFDGDNGGTWSGAANTSTSIKSLAVADLGITINVSDTITISESVNKLIPTLYINSSDNITVSEATATSGTDGVAVMDSSAISENVRLLIPTLFVTTSDAITVTESVVGDQSIVVAVSDPVTVTEALQTRLDALVSVSDSVAVSEGTTVSAVASATNAFFIFF